MPDTGAPWNIPYVEAADLVRDYPAASLALGTAIAAGLSSASNVRQIQTVTSTTDFNTSSTSAVDLTGAAVTITPESATNRLLMMFTCETYNTGGSPRNRFQFRRDTTDLFEEVNIRFALIIQEETFSMNFDEVANDTSARTYKIRMRVSSDFGHVLNYSLIVVEYQP
jgi:hypothetical protein